MKQSLVLLYIISCYVENSELFDLDEARLANESSCVSRMCNEGRFRNRSTNLWNILGLKGGEEKETDLVLLTEFVPVIKEENRQGGQRADGRQPADYCSPGGEDIRHAVDFHLEGIVPIGKDYGNYLEETFLFYKRRAKHTRAQTGQMTVQLKSQTGDWPLNQRRSEDIGAGSPHILAMSRLTWGNPGNTVV